MCHRPDAGERAAVRGSAPAVEFQVKATFLYNFAQFIQWPPHAFAKPDAPFTICVAGDPFREELEKIISGEKLGTRPMVVRRLASGGHAAGCQML
jgi:hypothetical protein